MAYATHVIADNLAIKPGTTVKQAVGATHAETAAISASIVRLVSTTDCYVVFGSDPVADNTAIFLPAKVPEYFQFSIGNKISVIRDSADGNLFITPAA